MENNIIKFKLNRKNHFDLKLPRLSKKYQSQLNKLQVLSENKVLPYTIKLTSTHIYITFDETLIENVKTFKTFNNRVCSLDLNPNEIGVSILSFNKDNSFKVLHKTVFDLSQLTIKSKENSSSKQSKYLQNKLQHENYQIIQNILNLVKHYQVKHITIEKLDKSSMKFKFKKSLNRLIQNKWLVNKFVSNLEKHCRLYNLNLIKVFPYYSSLIGNIIYKEYDPVSSSIEIGRRGFECLVQKNKSKFYPKFDIDLILKYCHWKNITLKDNIKDWKDLNLYLKNLKVRYRVSLNDLTQSFIVFRNKSCKSKVIKLNFVYNL